MAESNLFDDIQHAIDGMQHVVQQCAAEECSVGDMWTEIDGHCQRLAQLSAGDVPDDEEDEEDDEAPKELNFDDVERSGEDDDEEAQGYH